MESSSTGIGRLDCYEDMFKEITRKLYGDDPDHRTSNVQNEFEASVTFKPEEALKADEDEAATQASDDAGCSWILGDEPLKGADGSRIAAYRAATSTWRCYECGDCMAGGAHEIAEHFMDLHASRFDDSASRGGAAGTMHRKDYLGPSYLKLEEIVSYLERVRERADRLGAAPPTRRTQETQTVPAVLLPVAPNFFLQDLPSPTPLQQLVQPQQQASPTTSSSGSSGGGGSSTACTAATRATTHQQSAPAAGTGGGGGAGKRYTCLYCPYGTDRRDLYTRHENIHREEKPFHCYVCYKPFSRADHVKKHFLRMHREHTYELSRIRKPVGPSPSFKPLPQARPAPASPADAVQHEQQQQQQLLQPASGSLDAAAIYQAATAISSALVAATATVTATTMAGPASAAQPQPAAPTAASQQPSRRAASHNPAGKSQLGKSVAGSSSSSKNQERRYTCCYCSWSGVDNWCLKRHLNTHLKPFACALCEYKAARAERLSTHVLKVHNRRQCSRCSFLAEDLPQLQVHQLHVHRANNQATCAPAASPVTTAPATLQQRQETAANVPLQRSQGNQQDQMQPFNGGGGGRAPPGPPVFPASSAAIAPATTVIPPTTVLGDRASMPGSGSWEQEASSCEARFQPASHGSEPGRRSRKQTTPRKITTTCCETDLPSQTVPRLQAPSHSASAAAAAAAKPKAKLLKCYQCPKRSIARIKAYHSRASLLLHKMWWHTRPRLDMRRPSVAQRA